MSPNNKVVLSLPLASKPGQVISLLTHSQDLYQNWGAQYLMCQKIREQYNVSGEGIVVAVLDSGIDSHPDIYKRIKNGTSCIGYEPTTTDLNGHGTHVAGTILNVAPNCSLVPIKVLDRTGEGSLEAVLKGLQFAIDKQVDIISMSFGGIKHLQLENLVKKALAQGIHVIVAAGNFGDGDPNTDDIKSPASMDTHILTVGAMEKDGSIAEFSSDGVALDIIAPGVDISSAYLNGGYEVLSGTSMAAPHVTGAIALSLEFAKQRGLGRIRPSVLHEFVKASADDAGLPGEDNFYGAGCLNLANLLEKFYIR